MHRLAIVCALLSTTAIVIAAPAGTAKAVQRSQNAKTAKSTNVAKSLKRRAKRAVLVEEVPILPIEDDDALVARQLEQLSDAELEALAELVQNRVDTYNPEADVYEVVQVPRPLVVAPIIAEVDDDDDAGDADEVVELFPRDRRSIPMELMDDDSDLPLEPELVFVPESAVEEALEEAQNDEIELRSRIAELAQLLNERATRLAF